MANPDAPKSVRDSRDPAMNEVSAWQASGAQSFFETEAKAARAPEEAPMTPDPSSPRSQEPMGQMPNLSTIHPMTLEQNVNRLDAIRARVRDSYKFVAADDVRFLLREIDQLSEAYAAEMRENDAIREERDKDGVLARDLCEVLMHYCGEAGATEGAVETLKRIAKELDAHRAWRRFEAAQKAAPEVSAHA